MSFENVHATETDVAQSQVVVETDARRDSPAYGTAVGKHVLAFDGFVMLDAVDSPFKEVRQGLEAKIIDQQPAVDAILDSIDRIQVRPPDDHRPVATLAFLGPTGVGKSETAKTLPKLLNTNSEKGANLIKIDCSSYSHGHEVTSLVGSPPSYIGREQVPTLAKDKVEVPGTVILFDEIEKGSTALYNLMLQIMGDGQLQLNTGETVNFRNTVIVLTSNLGAKEMSAQLSDTPLGFAAKERSTDKAALEKVALKSFTDFFAPEFVNRLTKMIVFHPLTEEGLSRVLDVKLAEANEHYEKEFGVRMTLSDETRAQLVSIAAREPHLGARPLIRALEDNVESVFGRYNKSGLLPEGTHVRVMHRNEVPQHITASADTSPFLFTAKPDASIRKYVPPLALPAAEVSQEVGPEPDEQA